jgi:copper chaperone CopZ
VRAKEEEERMNTKTYSVPGMHCGHCKAAVSRELEAVTGVERVDVDLETKLVTVRGATLDDAALIAAIDEAGYDAERVAA